MSALCGLQIVFIAGLASTIYFLTRFSLRFALVAVLARVAMVLAALFDCFFSAGCFYSSTCENGGGVDRIVSLIFFPAMVSIRTVGYCYHYCF